MTHALAGTTVAGAAALAGCILALVCGYRLKRAENKPPFAVVGMWATLSAYMLGFTLIRGVGWISPGTDLAPFYVFQTLAGASTIVALVYIIAEALWRPWVSGFATGAFLGVAAITVQLIFMHGYEGPIDEHWSLEFLPHSVAARILVGAVYVVVPIVLAGLIRFSAAKGASPEVRHRLTLFALAIVLIWIPNAGKYVLHAPGIWNLVEAVVMAGGAWLGWWSYKLANSSGNG